MGKYYYKFQGAKYKKKGQCLAKRQSLLTYYKRSGHAQNQKILNKNLLEINKPMNELLYSHHVDPSNI